MCVESRATKEDGRHPALCGARSGTGRTSTVSNDSAPLLGDLVERRSRRGIPAGILLLVITVGCGGSSPSSGSPREPD
ncbi:MAG: hypothetical protein KDC38_16710, partial [Planctomycetes bacterium]|nr:hypothetical protein [Planctomycetota bacterium]